MTTPSPPILDMRNIQVMRGQRIVLDNFSLSVAATDHVAILGPNGCGKSTLVKTIMRECYPVVQAGSSMTILGKDRWNVFELRTMLGIVSNDLMTEITGDATGLEVVLSGFFSSIRVFNHHILRPEQKQLAHAILARLDASYLADRPVCQMSSGEARRILIARALVHEPRALLFDEPSNSLDISARHSLRGTMSMLAASGIGIILVTHDLADIIPEIDRVLLMREGSIVADGPKAQILTGERLQELFGVKVVLEQRDGFYHLS